jgi:hypothetical protein
MDTLCHAALVCCILSALAGLVRTFWPQNGFKPVINAVLTLYIITSVLHAVSGLNWQNFDAQLQNFASQSAPGEDYTAYGAELAMQESAAALQKLLRQSGIESVVQPQAGCMCGWFTRRTGNRRKPCCKILRGTCPIHWRTPNDRKTEHRLAAGGVEG